MHYIAEIPYNMMDHVEAKEHQKEVLKHLKIKSVWSHGLGSQQISNHSWLTKGEQLPHHCWILRCDEQKLLTVLLRFSDVTWVKFD